MLQKLHVARQYTGIMSSESQVPTVEWTDILCLQFNSRVTAATLQWGFNTRIPSSISSRFLGQLTELNLDLSHVGDKSVDLATVIIRQCQLLKSLKLEIFSFPDEPDVGGPQGSHSTGNIALPHLTVLSLIVTMSPEAADFVNRLYLPSLKELHLQISDYGPMNHIQLAKEMSIELLRACGDTLQSLTLYSPLIMFFLPLNPVDMMQILHLTPHLKSLKMSSFQLSHKRWVSGVLVASRMSGCQKFINDELLCALSPLGKDYSETICPQLEVLEFDYNLITAITEHGLKEFLAARRQAHLSDSRIAALQHLTVSINQLKPKEDQRENKMTLPGGNTTVYFRRPEHVEFSPWEGLELKYREQRSSAYFIQHELYS
ncbi:hypothetical protein BDQ17DRAFT_956019 [Cyathus striatus]|nr:hypothetical protein BDQ17DRAFT_956019 [Cyathus striatus]